ncbi:tetratricopeptide repeat protein, partial [Aquimarina litoralis]|uniref:tetratricopeptide repeat protein n=1 Tax=Aquimarina litoralis TaxID=584605 RepID=UPI001C5A5278
MSFLIKYHTSLFSLFFSLVSISVLGQGISHQLDSIHNLPGTDFEKLSIYQDLLDTYTEQENYTQFGYDATRLAKWIYMEKKWDEAINLVKAAYKAREIATPLDTKQLKISYYNYARYNKRKGNLNIAISFFKKMLTLDESEYLKGRALYYIGSSYNLLGDYYKAVEYQKISFEHFDPTKDLKYIIRTHNAIAVSYRNIRNTPSARKGIYHLQIADSLLAQNKKPNKIDQYSVYNNLAAFYTEEINLKDVPKGISYFNKALKIAQKEGFKSFLPEIYFNLAIAHLEVDSSISQLYFDKALKHSENLPSLIPDIYFGLAIKDVKEQLYLEAQKDFAITFSYYFGMDKPNIYWLPKESHMKNIVDKAYFLQILKEKLKAWILWAQKENNPTYFN